jgi:hypothetical protein
MHALLYGDAMESVREPAHSRGPVRASVSPSHLPARPLRPPPPGVSNALVAQAATVLLQRATRVDAKLKPNPRGMGLLTEHGLYNLSSNVLYAFAGSQRPRRCESEGAAKRGNRAATKWVPDKRGFVEDCLHTAEEIMHDAVFKVPKKNRGGTVRSALVSKTGEELPFGDTDAGNIKAVKAAPRGARNLNSSARPGEAFVIVETNLARLSKEGAYPYHAGGVVAEDGQDKITLEMFASFKHATEARRGNEEPTFRIYGTGAVGSFHDAWRTKAKFASPVTAVIKRP